MPYTTNFTIQPAHRCWHTSSKGGSLKPVHNESAAPGAGLLLLPRIPQSFPADVVEFERSGFGIQSPPYPLSTLV